MIFIEGEQPLVEVPRDHPFTDTLTGEPTDPTLVQLIVAVAGVTIDTYVYGQGVEIIRDGVGLYHATLDTTGKPGRWQVTWSSDPDGTQPQECIAIATTTFNVYPNSV